MPLLLNDILDNILILSADKANSELARLNDDLEENFEFSDFDDDLRVKLRSLLHIVFTDDCYEMLLGLQLLHLVRILSRDSRRLELLIDDNTVDLLCVIIQLSSKPTICAKYFDLRVLEGQKCLSNSLFHSSAVRHRFETSGGLQSLVSRLKARVELAPGTHELNSLGLPSDCINPVQEAVHVRRFDLRLAFISSAHSLSARHQLSIGPLVDLLEQHHGRTLHLDAYVDDDLMGELLKLLFNLICSPNDEQSEIDACAHLARICLDLILQTNTKQTQNAINLLTILPDWTPILPSNCTPDSHCALVHEGKDMSFPDAVLKLLETKLESVDKSDTDLLSTYLTVLIRLCHFSKEARRYLRLKVVPPLHAQDVDRRPEECDSFRGRLVRLMSGTSQCNSLAAQWLFVLCKQDVSRLIKYSGLGNAAGLLANNGLLGSSLTTDSNSSDSEDSQTEDYQIIRNQVDPVLGCVPPPMPSQPEITDEQKEYETMQLVESLQKLMDRGVIRPGTVKDGRVKSVDNLLQFREEYADNREENEEDDSI